MSSTHYGSQAGEMADEGSAAEAAFLEWLNEYARHEPAEQLQDDFRAAFMAGRANLEAVKNLLGRELQSANAAIMRQAAEARDPVATLREIADQDIGGNAPWLADELHGLADRLAASMRGESPKSCYFWDIRNGECHFEVLVPGCSPCAACPGGDAPDVARRYSFTRSELVDALTHLEVSVPVSSPDAGKINAESMADALIAALESETA